MQIDIEKVIVIQQTHGMDNELARVYDWEIEVIGPLNSTSLSCQLGEKRDELQELEQYEA